MSSTRRDTPHADDTRARSTELLRERGLRVTGPRLAVLDVLEKRSHLSAEEVAVEVRASHGAVSTQAVYDVLHTLSSVGLLRAIEPAGSATRYERRVGDNHHHLVCRQCGSVHDVPCVAGAAPCLEPSETAGFSIDEAEVTFWGTCPDCQHRSSTKES